MHRDDLAVVGLAGIGDTVEEFQAFFGDTAGGAERDAERQLSTAQHVPDVVGYEHILPDGLATRVRLAWPGGRYTLGKYTLQLLR